MASVLERTSTILKKQYEIRKFNFNSLCRLCLSENNEKISIFKFADKNHTYGTLTLCDRIMICGSVKVEKDDGLPDGICETCFTQIDKTFFFKEQCKRSDFTLRKYLKRDDSQLDNIYDTYTSAKFLKDHSYHAIPGNTNARINDDSDDHLVALADDDSDGPKMMADEEKTVDVVSKISVTPKVKTFKCLLCVKTFNSHSALYYHKLKHSGTKRHGCRFCDKTFHQRCSLVKHERVHTGEKPFTCDRCGKSFGQETNLKFHAATHDGEKVFCCHVCGKAFTLGHNLKEHLKIHGSSRPRLFGCTKCDKRFYHRSHLANHMDSHSDVKPFTCHICDKKFSKSSYLKQHQLTHTGHRPFPCKMCTKSFTSSGNLAAHVRSHDKSARETWTCTVCNKRLLNKTKLLSHMDSCRISENNSDPLVMQVSAKDRHTTRILDTSLANFSTKFNISDTQTISLHIFPSFVQ